MSDSKSRQRVLDKATTKFMESGITKVTLDEVATELSMSKKTVYKYFPSKDDLLREVVRLMLAGVEREVTAIVNSDEPFERKMTRLLALIGKMVRRVGRQFQVDVQRFAPSLWKEIDTFRRERIFVKVKQMFQQAKQENIFRNDLDVELFYLVFINTAQGIMNPKILSENSFSAEEAFRGIIKIMYEGVLTEEGRKRAQYFETNYDQQL
jgi:AcrR family transcriptional regulator